VGKEKRLWGEWILVWRRVKENWARSLSQNDEGKGKRETNGRGEKGVVPIQKRMRRKLRGRFLTGTMLGALKKRMKKRSEKGGKFPASGEGGESLEA